MEIFDYIINVGPIYLVEILAGLAGIYYLKNRAAPKSTRWLVIFLWVTVAIEGISSYAVIAYFSDYKSFSFVKDTPFEDNKWLFNIYIILNFAFFIYYFGSYLKGELMRQLVKYSVISYVLASIGYLFVTDIYFTETSHFANIVGTLLLLAVVILFYFQLLKSDTILNLKYFLPFYISIGVLIFNLCITPLDIFSKFYSEENIIFWKFKKITYLFSNLFMYSSFILGFIVCRRKKYY